MEMIMNFIIDCIFAANGQRYIERISTSGEPCHYSGAHKLT